MDDELGDVDGSDVDRVVSELKARGGADAVLGDFLWRKIIEYYTTVDPECCVGDAG